MDKQTVKNAVFSISEAVAALEVLRKNAPRPAIDDNREYVNWLRINGAIAQLQNVLNVLKEVSE